MNLRHFLFMIMVFVLFPVLHESHACSCAAPTDYVADTEGNVIGIWQTLKAC